MQEDNLQTNVECLIYEAIELFNKKEKFTIEHNVKEQNACTNLAYYIKQLLPKYNLEGYDVDTEYNRGYCGNDNAPKQLCGKLIAIDIIVHKRGYNDGYDNLICMEMKKSSSSPQKIQLDKERLEKLTSLQYGYQYKFGYMLIINQIKNELEIDSKYILH